MYESESELCEQLYTLYEVSFKEFTTLPFSFSLKNSIIEIVLHKSTAITKYTMNLFINYQYMPSAAKTLN